MAETNLKYFSFTILYVLVLYIAILAIFLCIRRREIKVRQLNRPQNMFHVREHDNDAYYSFEWTSSVDDVTESWMGGDVSRMILLGMRVVSLLYLLFGGLAFYGSQYPVSFYYFDGWTLIITSIYFFFATVLSALKVEVVRARAGLDIRLNPYYSIVDWTYFPRLMAVTCHMLFEVACASNFLCAFGVMFQASPDSDDIVVATSISICLLFLDLGLNNLRFRFDQFPASIAWVVFYLLCVWPAVFTGSMRKWPYPFMAVDTVNCFLYYSILFISQFISFLGWYMIFRVKRLVLYYLEFKGILIPITIQNPYALREYSDLDSDTSSQISGRSNQSRESLRSRTSRASDKDSVASGRSNHSQTVVNSFLYAGDGSDFNTQGIAMRAMPLEDDNGSVFGFGSVYNDMHYASANEPMTPEQQQHFYEQQRMWNTPIPMIPPPPNNHYPNTATAAATTAADMEEGTNAEERKATTSAEELALSQQQQQQLELQQLQQQTIMQQHQHVLNLQQQQLQMQQQQQQQMAMPPPGWPMMMPPPPGMVPPAGANDHSDILRMYPHLQDPAYLLEQQQQLYLFNLLHHKDNETEAIAPPMGAQEQDFFNPSFPTVPPTPFAMPAPPMGYPPMHPMMTMNPMYPMGMPNMPPYPMDPAQFQQFQEQQIQLQQQMHMQQFQQSTNHDGSGENKHGNDNQNDTNAPAEGMAPGLYPPPMMMMDPNMMNMHMQMQLQPFNMGMTDPNIGNNSNGTAAGSATSADATADANKNNNNNNNNMMFAPNPYNMMMPFPMMNMPFPPVIGDNMNNGGSNTNADGTSKTTDGAGHAGEVNPFADPALSMMYPPPTYGYGFGYGYGYPPMPMPMPMSMPPADAAEANPSADTQPVVVNSATADSSANVNQDSPST